MKILWAPWRRSYVTTVDTAAGCVFCQAIAQCADSDSLVVHVAPLSFVMMNLFPYNSGHILVAPRRHVGRLPDLTSQELHEMVVLAQRLATMIEDAYRPQGMNLGMNLGRTAGAGIEDHIHLHLVPRWNGDTNFMTVVGETRVIPEDPREACRRLRGYFA
jgi:ATP adenylyltransferase